MHLSNTLGTFSVLGTRGEDVDQLVSCIQSRLPVLTCTLQLREEFKQEVTATAGLLHVDDPNWPGIGVVRYGISLSAGGPPLPYRARRAGHCVGWLSN